MKNNSEKTIHAFISLAKPRREDCKSGNRPQRSSQSFISSHHSLTPSLSIYLSIYLSILSSGKKKPPTRAASRQAGRHARAYVARMQNPIAIAIAIEIRPKMSKKKNGKSSRKLPNRVDSEDRKKSLISESTQPTAALLPALAQQSVGKELRLCSLLAVPSEGEGRGEKRNNDPLKRQVFRI